MVIIYHHIICFSDTLAIGHVKPVEVVRTGHRGPPCKKLNLTLLQAAMAPGRCISVSKLARIIGIHQNTLHFYLKKYKIDYQHTPISDGDLDLLVKHFHSTKPQTGLQYLSGSLRRHGLCIQRQHITESLH